MSTYDPIAATPAPVTITFRITPRGARLALCVCGTWIRTRRDRDAFTCTTCRASYHGGAA